MTTLHITVMTKRYAEAWTRRIMNIPPESGLGWKPYTTLVMKGASSYRGFHRLRDVRTLPELRGKSLRFTRSRGEGFRLTIMEV